MLRVAVCDDELIINNVISNTIREFFAKKGEVLELHTFLSAENLLNECTNKSFDIIFLDIDMPDMSGIEFATKLRKYDEQTEIVFISNRDDLVFSAIKQSPFRFIKKSEMQELEEALEALYEKKRRSEVVFDFPTLYGKVSKKLVDIWYVEVYGHDLVIHLKDNSFQSKGALNTLEKQIGKDGFIRIHNSFLVNYRYIFAINSKDLTLDNFKKLPVSRYRMDDIKIKLQMFSRCFDK